MWLIADEADPRSAKFIGKGAECWDKLGRLHLSLHFFASPEGAGDGNFNLSSAHSHFE